ncbi:MAG: DUF3570 domain-containing protein [Deltaproteobacteria bacterium]|nr:DUF3570 domain-containing protein [Deltaproteobacteria bacterium]
MTELRRFDGARATTLGFLLGVVLGPSAALAESDRVSSSVMLYSDDSHVRVLATTIEGNKQVGEAISASAAYTVDVVSAASVDVVTSASPAGFEELRHQARAAFEYDFGEGTKAGVDYGASVEPDFVGHGVQATYAFDLLERNVTLGFAYGFQLAAIGQSRARTLEHERLGHDLSATFSQVLGQRTVADVGASLGVATGYLANPYRLVRVFEPEAANPSTAVPEALPDARTSGSILLRVRQELLPSWHALLEYKLYSDDWGLMAHTAFMRQTLGFLDDTVLVSAELRGYLQGAADLYRARYETFPNVPIHRSADKELGGMSSLLGGLDLEWSSQLDFADALRLGLGLDVYGMSYDAYPALSGRLAFVGSFDVTLEI